MSDDYFLRAGTREIIFSISEAAEAASDGNLYELFILTHNNQIIYKTAKRKKSVKTPKKLKTTIIKTIREEKTSQIQFKTS